MELFTDAQFAQLCENGRCQAAIRGTNEINLAPIEKLFDPANRSEASCQNLE